MVVDTAQRMRRLGELLCKFEPVPVEWLSNGVLGLKVTGEANSLGVIPCFSYAVVVNKWRAAFKWTDGLDSALSVMLACVISTEFPDDQLWVKVISPPSSGKSSLCEALGVAKKYVIAKDTFTGLTSGYQKDSDGSENVSLAPKLHNMTLVINDGDTLLSLPNLDKVLSEMRAFYGRNLRSQYKNLMSADHEGINNTMILCGTSSLHKLDASELGERFLTVIIMEGIDDELEDEVLLRVAYRAERNLVSKANGDPMKRQDSDLTGAMQLTGGFVHYLRENAEELLSSITMDESALRLCTRLGKFVAFMRARPTIKQDEILAEREFASRLVSQMTRLAKCVAAVLGERTVNDAVMRRVRRVALDTARGRTLNICRELYAAGDGGLEVRQLAHRTNRPEEKKWLMMRFLKQIEVVERFTAEVKGLSNGQTRWRLTPKVRKLYDEVVIR